MIIIAHPRVVLRVCCVSEKDTLLNLGSIGNIALQNAVRRPFWFLRIKHGFNRPYSRLSARKTRKSQKAIKEWSFFGEWLFLFLVLVLLYIIFSRLSIMISDNAPRRIHRRNSTCSARRCFGGEYFPRL